MKKQRKYCPKIFQSVVQPGEAKDVARVFAALADPVRVRLLSILARARNKEITVCKPMPALKLSQPTLSHHFRVMHEAGLVIREKRAQWVYYRLNEEAIGVIREALFVQT